MMEISVEQYNKMAERLTELEYELDKSVKVIRCKDCKYKGGNGYDEDVCWEIEPQHGVYVSDNWYCADGERRE